MASGGIDRIRTLFIIGFLLATTNASEVAITQALAERDITLGYWKYAGQRDQAIRYSEMTRKVLDIRRALYQSRRLQ